MNSLDKCKNTTNQKIFSFVENRQKIEILNPRCAQFNYYFSDKCFKVQNIVENQQIIADLIVERDANERIFIVELKGRDVEHGIEQILNTIQIMNQIFGENKNYRGAIVSRRCPSFVASDFKKIQKKMVNQQCLFIIKTRMLSVAIDDAVTH